MLAWLKLDACYHRYRFNLTTGETKEERIEDLLSEFPVINNRYGGLSSKYSYHVTLADTDVILFDGIIKMDSSTGTRQRYIFPEGCYGSELQFAPRDNSKAEDDGYLISFITNTESGKGEIQIFPAEDLSKGPLCRLIVPQQIPPGFHSSFVLPENL
jgi:carotenoid cleavage dioxygenase